MFVEIDVVLCDKISSCILKYILVLNVFSHSVDHQVEKFPTMKGKFLYHSLVAVINCVLLV